MWKTNSNPFVVNLSILTAFKPRKSKLAVVPNVEENQRSKKSHVQTKEVQVIDMTIPQTPDEFKLELVEPPARKPVARIAESNAFSNNPKHYVDLIYDPSPASNFSLEHKSDLSAQRSVDNRQLNRRQSDKENNNITKVMELDTQPFSQASFSIASPFLQSQVPIDSPLSLDTQQAFQEEYDLIQKSHPCLLQFPQLTADSIPGISPSSSITQETLTAIRHFRSSLVGHCDSCLNKLSVTHMYQSFHSTNKKMQQLCWNCVTILQDNCDKCNNELIVAFGSYSSQVSTKKVKKALCLFHQEEFGTEFRRKSMARPCLDFYQLTESDEAVFKQYCLWFNTWMFVQGLE